MSDTEKLVEANLKLVSWAIAKWVPYHLRRRDKQPFQSAALEGLWKAAKFFDPSKGFKFSTYATTCLFHQLKKAVKQEESHHQRQATCDLKEPAYTQSEAEEEVEDTYTKAEKLLADPYLSTIQQQVGRLLYLEGLSAPQAAERLGVSKQRVGAARQMLLQKLRRVY